MADSLPTVDGYETYLKATPAKFFFRKLEEEDVALIIKKQQPKLSTGVDQINNKNVKRCHIELAKPMTHIINLSIKQGKVPLLYKIAE